MIYIFDTELKTTTIARISLTYILGINKSSSNILCKKLGFSQNLKIKNFTEEQVNSLTKLIIKSNIKVNSDLIKQNNDFFKKSISIKSYRGLRRLSKLPVRGQRTHNNSKTCKRSKY